MRDRTDIKKSNTKDRLYEIMSERDLKQIDLVRMCQPYCEKYGVRMNKADVSQYCSGKVEPSQSKLVILGLALGVSEAWLMGFDVDRAKKMHRRIGQYDALLTEDERLRDVVEMYMKAPPRTQEKFVDMANILLKD